MNSDLKARIEEITQMIFEYASGNLDYQINRSDKDDELDGIIVGITMLNQELKESTVSRDYMSSIYRGVVDMLFVLGPDFNIQSINAAVTRQLEYGENELRNISEVLTPEALAHLIRLRPEVDELTQMNDVELTFRGRSGNENTGHVLGIHSVRQAAGQEWGTAYCQRHYPAEGSRDGVATG